MSASTGSAGDRLHLALAILSIWLVGTSPWLAMLRRIPAGAGWLDWSHVVLGLAALALAAAYAWTCVRHERRRLYFPWLPPQSTAVLRDLAGLLRGRLPAAEGGGLIGLVEGLLLLALLATGLTGLGWFLTQGGEQALGWRAAHIACARAFFGLLVAHVVTVAFHLLDFVRD
jgi:cytochrome b561